MLSSAIFLQGGASRFMRSRYSRLCCPGINKFEDPSPGIISGRLRNQLPAGQIPKLFSKSAKLPFTTKDSELGLTNSLTSKKVVSDSHCYCSQTVPFDIHFSLLETDSAQLPKTSIFRNRHCQLHSNMRLVCLLL